MPPRRRPTSTSNFGAGRRESHDSSSFYARFTAPAISDDATLNACPVADRILTADARDMSAVPDACVALVVTSPPYFAGKAYEEEMGQGHIPADYVEYLEMLRDVFAQCVRVLEPGGRIAVNVANLGRKPYRSLAADIMTILQDDLALLPRGEVVWVKGKGATGSTAWGSFQSAANPVLRDLSERIVIASKGRFDRAVSRPDRRKLGLPHENTISKEEFMAATLDVWHIAPASAKRVGHPAPFPIDLPGRCIRLFTYLDDVVLDPFMGSGTTAVAAVHNGRRFLGFETDPSYVALAEVRIAAARTAVVTSGLDHEINTPAETA